MSILLNLPTFILLVFPFSGFFRSRGKAVMARRKFGLQLETNNNFSAITTREEEHNTFIDLEKVEVKILSDLFIIIDIGLHLFVF